MGDQASEPYQPSGVAQQEIEWQYEAPHGLEPVAKWLGGREPGGFVVLEGSFNELTDTYYDTEDWRLYRAGCALRVRRGMLGRGPEATMKYPIFTGSNLHRRCEISETLKGSASLRKAPGPVGVRVRELAGSRELRRIFEVRTRRQTFDLLLGGRGKSVESAEAGVPATRVGGISLDDSEIPLDECSARLTHVEVEVYDSAASAFSKLEGFVKVMEETLGLRPATISKYEAGLSATGQNPDGEADPEARA